MKENCNLACDHIEPCNIEQSERHNRRDPEYIASLDPRTIYVRLELTQIIMYMSHLTWRARPFRMSTTKSR